MSVRPYARVTATPSGRISVKIGTGGTFMKVCRENTGFVKTGQLYQALFMKTFVSVGVSGDIKSP